MKKDQAKNKQLNPMDFLDTRKMTALENVSIKGGSAVKDIVIKKGFDKRDHYS